MSLKDCITELTNKINLDEKVKDSYKRRLDNIKNDLNEDIVRRTNRYIQEEGLDEVSAGVKAEKDAVKYFQEKKKFDAFGEAQSAYRLKKTKAEQDSHPDNLTAGLGAIIIRDVTGRSKIVSIEEISYGAQALLARPLADFIEEARAKFPGGFLHSEAMLLDVNRELTGQSTGNALAKGYAEAILKSQDMAINLKRSLGIPANKLEKRGFGQNYDRFLVRGSGKVANNREEFVDFMMKKIDMQRTIDDFGNRFTEEEMKEIIRNTFDDIVTGGASKKVRHGRVDYKKRLSSYSGKEGMHRFFVFKSPEDQIAVHQRYGRGSLFDNLMNEIEGSAMDIAMGVKFGKYYEKNFDMLEARAIAQKGTSDAKRSITEPITSNRRMFNYLKGDTKDISNATLARVSSGLRSLATALYLPKAVLSSFSDLAYSADEAQLLGMSASRVFGRTLKHILTLDKKSARIMATRLGLSADYARGLTNAASRWHDNPLIGGMFSQGSAILSDFTMRGSGLVAWTRIGQQSFLMEMQHVIADNAGSSFNKLDPRLRKVFESRGLGDAEWNKIREAAVEIDGVKHIDTDQLDPELALTYYGILNSHAKKAVPEAQTEVRALASGGSSSGSVEREFLSHFYTFKTFPVTVLMNTIRTFQSKPTKLSKAAYAAKIATYTTLLGALSVQARAIVEGEEPYPWDSPELWTRAFLLGPAGVFVSDYIKDLINGKSSAEATAGIIGPALGLVGTWASFLVDMGKDMFGDEKKAKTPGHIIDGMERAFIPGNFPYTRPVTKSFIWNQLREDFDPKYGDRKRNHIRRLKQQDRDLLF